MAAITGGGWRTGFRYIELFQRVTGSWRTVKKKINLRIKTEHVTVDADATVYVWLLSQIMCKQKRDVYRRIQLQPWQAPFLCGDFFFCADKRWKTQNSFSVFCMIKKWSKGVFS